jgi:hypothetical protein
LPVGEEIPETWLTTWRYFTELMAEYNRRCQLEGRAGVDAGVGELRNALAHGSLTAASADEPVTLIRYDRPREGTVRVTEKHVVTLEWLTRQSDRVAGAAAIVLRHLNELR